MLLKLLGYGIYDYIKKPLNLFDGLIVILSIIELSQSSTTSGLAVLRTFRLMRVLKLFHFLPSLRRQIIVMIKTLDSVGVFFLLLVLFLFIFRYLD